MQLGDRHRRGDLAVSCGRDELRSRIQNFIEIYMHCPLEVLVERDVKGLYKKALCESPLAPQITIDSSKESPEETE
jgi:adenylylsulfate kinase-like enzyme